MMVLVTCLYSASRLACSASNAFNSSGVYCFASKVVLEFALTRRDWRSDFSRFASSGSSPGARFVCVFRNNSASERPRAQLAHLKSPDVKAPGWIRIILRA